MASTQFQDAIALAEQLEAIIENPENYSRTQERRASPVGVEQGIFDLLSEADSNVQTATVAQTTDIDPVLTRRLLQYYQSVGMIAQHEKDAYAANNVTKALAAPVGHSGIKFLHDVIGPPMFAIPQYFKENGYRNTRSEGSLPWSLGHRTTLSVFSYLQQHPELLAPFLSWMKFNRDGLPVFLDTLDFEKEHGRATDDSTVLFVDVGGSVGHQALLFKQRNPSLRGRVIVQDLPATIEMIKANPLPGFDGIGFDVIEAIPHDFFTPQPVKVPRLICIFHDWSDDKCIEILRNLRPSMSQDSVVMIDEIVLSEKGAPHRATQYDIIMMVATGAMERTGAEWESLLDRAEFKIRKIWKYAEDCDDCVIVAVPK